MNIAPSVAPATTSNSAVPPWVEQSVLADPGAKPQGLWILGGAADPDRNYIELEAGDHLIVEA